MKRRCKLNIQIERKRRLMNQHDLAKKLNISQPEISLIESGYKKITKELHDKIIQVFSDYDNKSNGK